MKVDWSGTEEELKAVYRMMRPYQRDCVNKAIGSKRHIFSAKMGTGKTLMGLTSTIVLQPKRILIVCSVNALWTWKKELAKWFPSLAEQEGIYGVIRGTPTQRQRLWRQEHLFKVVTYGTLLHDAERVLIWNPEVVVADEFHRGGWKNPKAYQTKKNQKPTGAKGVTVARKIARQCKVIYLLSGSACRKGPMDYWGPLHLCDHKLFASYWKFVYTYHNVVDGHFGKEILGPKNVTGFKQMTAPYLTHIPKKVLENALPKITRETLKIPMSKGQEKFYTQMEQEMMAIDDDGNVSVASTTLTKLTRLRQVLCCPKLLDLNDMGAAIDMVIDKIKDLDDTHVVIFVPFIDVIPIFKLYLAKKLKVNVMTLQGGAGMEEVGEKTQTFNKSADTLMICSLLFAQSFELDSADYCFFVGYDFDQMNNQQAEGRLRRMTRADKPITAYYIKHLPPEGSDMTETVDDRVMEILSTNTRYVNITHDEYQPKQRKGNTDG